MRRSALTKAVLTLFMTVLATVFPPVSLLPMAYADANTHELHISLNNTEGGDVGGNLVGPVAEGEPLNVKCKSNHGYVFECWKDTTDHVWSQEKNFTLTMPDHDLSLTAYFWQVSINAIPDQEYTGRAIRPTVTVNLLGVDAQLVFGTDYTVSYSNNVNPGTATATLTFAGEHFKGTASQTFNIIPNGDPSPSDTKTTDGSSSKKRSSGTTASWIQNPDEKQQLAVSFGMGLNGAACAGYQEQGTIAKAAIRSAMPAGFSEAFEFNLLNSSGQPEMSLKQGTFTLLIPAEYRKAGRQFMLIALTEGGKPVLLSDIDTDPSTITVNVNHIGYAFSLIYKD